MPKSNIFFFFFFLKKKMGYFRIFDTPPLGFNEKF